MTAAKRLGGRGRRPSKPQMYRDIKRAGISVDALEPMLRRLEQLAGPKRDLATALRRHAEAGR